MAYLLTQLLERSANRYPDKLAVWARERTLTYRELVQQSSQLAQALRERGIRKGDRVGIYFPKAVESLVAMLGALKTGAIYVPLDPQSPAQRIEHIIGDCGIRCLITSRELLQGLNPANIGSVKFSVLTDANAKRGVQAQHIEWNELTNFPVCPPDVSAISTDLAYILYTSGSTGQPKGVMLSHLNALTFVEWCAAEFQIHSEDRLSNHAPLHFDLSVFDVYNTLEAGATMYMVPESAALFPTSLPPFIDKQGLTVWYSVPSALVLLLLHGNMKPHNLQGLRTILFAGEVFPMKYLRQLAERVPHAALYNLYGPTETNVCTYYHVDRALLAGQERLPIGRACGNSEVFAVKENGELAGTGEEGELWARGTCVTNGYWGAAEKTRQGVVPNNFQAFFEEKAYRTGDLVVQAADGNYLYAGRRDSMIKSRGYRIELGEIEAALLSHPGVMEAAAVATPDEEIGARIKAVVSPNEGQTLTAAELQKHCAARIPKYMIPETIEVCRAVPKTSTGKLDRVQLTKGNADDQALVTARNVIGRQPATFQT